MAEQLNERQQKAVQSTHTHTLIAAGPGTGKTRVLTHRIAHLIRHKNTSPSHILAVTFTRSAAKEIKDRLAAQFPPDTTAPLWTDTFHAIALRLLRENQYPFSPLNIIDEEQKIKILQNLIPKKQMPEFLDTLKQQKQRLQIPTDTLSTSYQKTLTGQNILDFDDLFIQTQQMFIDKPETLKSVTKKFQHILIDEFQDTSYAQYQFMKAISVHNLCVIGDPDQSIYGFTNQTFKPFEQYKKDYPQHQIHQLTKNHRSKGTIIEAAKQIINKNQAQLPRTLLAQLEKGFPIQIDSHQTDTQEAEMIVRRIESLLGGTSSYTINTQWAQKETDPQTYSLQDIAILYRYNAQARPIEKILERAGLPYMTHSKKPKQDGQIIPPAQEREDHQTNDPTLPSERITLMTLHRAKGLEFPVVFIAGCEQNILPSDTADPEEERRLFYVGITRAKNRLFLSYAQKRLLFGQTHKNNASPYLSDIEKTLYQIQQNLPPPKKPPKPIQKTLFE